MTLPPKPGTSFLYLRTLSFNVCSRCTGTKPLDCLRAVDGATLGDINLSVMTAGLQGTFTFVPVVDGLFITQSPTDALHQGKLNGVNLQLLR
jgi:carboxylesterase type B